MDIRNLDYLRGLPDFGAKLYEALDDLRRQVETVSKQINANGAEAPKSPPGVQGLKVQAQHGHFQVSIQDEGEISRGIHYYVEHSDNPNFTNPHVVDLGASRNANLHLGDVTRYFRAFSAYPTTRAGAPVYHGSQAQPMPVRGGGSNPGPAFLPSEGSGTGYAGVGLSGPGPVPFRTRPVREFKGALDVAPASGGGGGSALLSDNGSLPLTDESGTQALTAG